MGDEKKEIRFINSRYKELFRIEDGESIEICYPGKKRLEKECNFIDEYHTSIGGTIFHICEFAERMEAIGAEYRPVGKTPCKRRTDSYSGHALSSPSMQWGGNRR